MIYLVIPVGGSHGWGVFGQRIANELANLGEVRLIADNFTPESLGDDLLFHFLRRCAPSRAEIESIKNTARVDGDVFCAAGKSMVSPQPILKGRVTAGCVFFEDNVFVPEQIENAKRNFDILFTGSTWCTDILKNLGVETARTLVQGIDPTLFHPTPDIDKPNFRDKFVIFSGGKFEYRKSQDIVIRAFKVLQDRHRDVMLIAAWFNMWPYSIETMRASSLINFSPQTLEYFPMMQRVLTDNGIDLERVVPMPLRPNVMQPPIYRTADVGLFPNRCEGGTNLVMMEFMACGKPVVASYNSGHKDIITDDNAILIKQSKTVTVQRGGQPIANWDDPDLDETIERLEFAYQNRDKLKSIGARAGSDMKNWAWERTARQLKDDIAKQAS